MAEHERQELSTESPPSEKKVATPNSNRSLPSASQHSTHSTPPTHAPSSATKNSIHHGAIEGAPAMRGKAPLLQPVRTTTNTSLPPQVHSIFTRNQKRFIVFMASWAAFFSPISANIYLPALNPIARDLHVSDTLINLTLTSYMVFQGLAPTFMGSLADSAGRRPAYAVCFVIYIIANIGLALQGSYAALFVLRAIQSTGSSATIAMSSGVVADVATASERGRYMGFCLAGSLLGPAIGPIIGGVLAEYLGWRAIFWFLTIMATAFMVIFLIFFPETARTKVGNGSIPPEGWNMSLMNYLAIRKARQNASTDNLSHTMSQDQIKPKHRFRFPNPLTSLKLLLDKETSLLLFSNALLFAAFYDLTAVIPSQFVEIFNFNDLHIGLCFLPFGCGCMLGTVMTGFILDRNFARWSKKTGFKIRKGYDMDLRNFPVEKARLQIAIPATYCAALLILAWGWVLQHDGPLAALLVVLFFSSLSMTVAFNTVSTLLVDFYPKAPATSAATNNFVRCLLGAGATAVVLPMVKGIGRGWTFTALTLFLLVTSPMLWLIYFRGMGWREQRRVKEEQLLKKKMDEKLRHDLEGDGCLTTAGQPDHTGEISEEVGIVSIKTGQSSTPQR